MKQDPKDILKQYWGYSHFRPQQESIIQSVLQQKDTIALLPTGGGKSMCFQIPAIVNEGITIVISPLVALMKDQVLSLKEKGIKALAIPSGIKFQELDALLDNCIYGNYKFLYCSPERLQQEIVMERIKQMNVSLIAVDEAHCISQWGHDFRPAYRDIVRLREIKPDVPLIALTATATSSVLEDISTQLDLRSPAIFRSSYHRPNLTYTVIESSDKNFELEQHIKAQSQNAIVYVRNRKATVQTAQFLKSRGIPTTFYHGGMTATERHKNYTAWRENKVKVMVGTNAFGMGIDKADVALVVHLEIPDSIENYFQEAGRAGRDGQAAKAVLLYNQNDSLRLENQFLKIIPQVADVKEIYKRLNNYFQISFGEGEQSDHRFNFSAFCQAYGLKSMLTYNALRILDRNSVIRLSQEFTKTASVHFKVSDVALTYYLIKNPQLESVVKTVLRTYGGVFDQVVAINYSILGNKSETSIDKVHDVLLTLKQDDIIDYEYKNFDTAINFLVPREDDRTINVIAKYIEIQASYKKKQVLAVKSFLANTEDCRTIQLLKYFGEKHPTDCGQCDVCLQKGAPTIKGRLIEQAILEALRQDEKSSKELMQLGFRESELISALKLLLDQKKISITPGNTYTKL